MCEELINTIKAVLQKYKDKGFLTKDYEVKKTKLPRKLKKKYKKEHKLAVTVKCIGSVSSVKHIINIGD